MWRNLDKPKVKLRQLLYGVLESEAQNPVGLASNDLSIAGRQLMPSAAVNGLKYIFPVAATDRLRSELLPLLSEINIVTVRLSMTSDDRVKAACNQIADAVGDLLEHLDEKDGAFGKREDTVQAALGQLRQARDAAGRRRKRKSA